MHSDMVQVFFLNCSYTLVVILQQKDFSKKRLTCDINVLASHAFSLFVVVFQVQYVVWFFRKHRASSTETRALTDHHGNRLQDTSEVLHSSDLRSRFSIRLFSLLVFRAGPLDSGVYICGSAHRDFFFGFDLDIQEVHTLTFTPRLAPEEWERKYFNLFDCFLQQFYQKL